MLVLAPAAASAAEADSWIGRFSDVSEWGDHSSPLTQSLALLALTRAEGTAPSEAAVSLLLAQQCDEGGFPDAFVAPDDACVGGVDTTAHVVMALDALDETAAVGDAVAWLAANQNDDGSYSSADGVNTTSTGLAALALNVGGFHDAVDAARTWLRQVQDGCDTATPGALPFNADSRGEPQMGTAQGALGFTDVSLAELTTTNADAQPTTGCDDGAVGDPGVAAAAFLVDALVDGTHLVVQDFPSVGATIDVLFTLSAVGSGAATIDAIGAWLDEQIVGYTTEFDDDGPSGAYAGPTAKAALAMLVLGEDPRSAAGVDLIEQLESLEVTEDDTGVDDESVSDDARDGEDADPPEDEDEAADRATEDDSAQPSAEDDDQDALPATGSTAALIALAGVLCVAVGALTVRRTRQVAPR